MSKEPIINEGHKPIKSEPTSAKSTSRFKSQALSSEQPKKNTVIELSLKDLSFKNTLTKRSAVKASTVLNYMSCADPYTGTVSVAQPGKHLMLEFIKGVHTVESIEYVLANFETESGSPIDVSKGLCETIWRKRELLYVSVCIESKETFLFETEQTSLRGNSSVSSKTFEELHGEGDYVICEGTIEDYNLDTARLINGLIFDEMFLQI